MARTTNTTASSTRPIASGRDSGTDAKAYQHQGGGPDRDAVPAVRVEAAAPEVADQEARRYVSRQPRQEPGQQVLGDRNVTREQLRQLEDAGGADDRRRQQEGEASRLLVP